ncbi:MAG TPA: VOC family protein [Solirubrobacteraceae bacterium]|nr:VOC family protein [Solirubrobacteraceae bacterium]
MSEGDTGVRLRQAVIVAEHLEPVAAQLRETLGLGEPFRDPGVAEFGLENVVFALGDCFIEIVSPLREGTAAGRQLQRNGGDGGYMVLFDLRDLAGARKRAADAGVRVVWQIDLPDISGTHMHPADMRGAIVSLDRSEPYGTWRWGGPDWTGATGEGAPGRLLGITVAVAEPGAVAACWREVLGVPAGDGAQEILDLDGGRVCFVPAAEGACEAIVEIEVDVPDAAGGSDSVDVGGVRLRRAAPSP